MWDTTQKKMIWVKNSSGKVGQVWKDWEKYVVDNKGQWEEIDGTTAIYWPTWQEFPEGDSVGYYDTNEPTNVYEPEPVEPVVPTPDKPVDPEPETPGE